MKTTAEQFEAIRFAADVYKKIEMLQEENTPEARQQIDGLMADVGGVMLGVFAVEEGKTDGNG